MSYSFNVRAATKAEVLEQLKTKFDEVVQIQTVHALDRAQAEAAAQAFIGLLPDDENQDVSVSISGYLSGSWAGSSLTTVTGASVNVSAHLMSRVV